MPVFGAEASPDLHTGRTPDRPPAPLLTGYQLIFTGHGAPQVLRGWKLEDEREQRESWRAHQHPEHRQPARRDR